MVEETPLISEQLLKLLRCPLKGVPLELDGNQLVNKQFDVCYKIEDGVPILVPEKINRCKDADKII